MDTSNLRKLSSIGGGTGEEGVNSSHLGSVHEYPVVEFHIRQVKMCKSF